MTLKDRLNEDFKTSMKNKDGVRKDTISFTRAAIKQFEVDNRGETLDDAGIVAIIAKQVKMRKDALPDFEKAGRTDLADAYKAEIEVLTEYLPKQLSAGEILEIVKEVAASMGIESGKQNMGKLMGAVMGKVKGVADGNDVKSVVEEFLS
ncbi:MAG: GatB/YqeY domain-containing protein [Eubacteriales bacterium]|nr:GatB/YqeY domain-containing protein [Eubacteriales bacterium]MDD4389931.1 GatB/YqeY domain-containing protein [Eubacteriales bacterium]